MENDSRHSRQTEHADLRGKPLDECGVLLATAQKTYRLSRWWTLDGRIVWFEGFRVLSNGATVCARFTPDEVVDAACLLHPVCGKDEVIRTLLGV